MAPLWQSATTPTDGSAIVTVPARRAEPADGQP